MEKFTLIYKTNKEKTIEIFSDTFVKKNKGKFKILIGNKILPLMDKIKVKENTDKLKIKLIIFKGQDLNFKKMFYNCKSLIKFYLSSEKEIISNEINNIKNEEKNINFEDIYIQDNSENLYDKFYPNENEYQHEKINSIKINFDHNYKNMKKLAKGILEYSPLSTSINSYSDSSQNVLTNILGTYKVSKITKANKTESLFFASNSILPLLQGESSKTKPISLIDMTSMFSGCSSLISLPDISKWGYFQMGYK